MTRHGGSPLDNTAEMPTLLEELELICSEYQVGKKVPAKATLLLAIKEWEESDHKNRRGNWAREVYVELAKLQERIEQADDNFSEPKDSDTDDESVVNQAADTRGRLEQAVTTGSIVVVETPADDTVNGTAALSAAAEVAAVDNTTRVVEILSVSSDVQRSVAELMAAIEAQVQQMAADTAAQQDLLSEQQERLAAILETVRAVKSGSIPAEFAHGVVSDQPVAVPEDAVLDESAAEPTDFEAMKARLIGELDVELPPGKRRHISPELKRFAVEILFPKLRETRDLSAFLKAHGLHSPTPSIWAKQLETHDAVEETVGEQVLNPSASAADTVQTDVEEAEPETVHDSVTEPESETVAAEPVQQVESALLPDDFAQKKAAFEAALIVEPGKNRRVSTELKQFAVDHLFPSLRRERSLTTYLHEHGLNTSIPTIWKGQMKTKNEVSAAVPGVLDTAHDNGAVPATPPPVRRTRSGADTTRYSEVRVSAVQTPKRAPSLRSWEKALDDGFTREERLQILEDVAANEGNVPALQALYAAKSITVRQVLDWRARYGKYSREKLLGNNRPEENIDDDDDDNDTDGDDSYLADDVESVLLPAAEIGAIVYDPLVDLNEQADNLFHGDGAKTVAGAYRASVIAQTTALSPEKRERLRKLALLSTELLTELHWAEWHDLICEKFGLVPSEKTEQYARLIHTAPAARSEAQVRLIETLAQSLWPYRA